MWGSSNQQGGAGGWGCSRWVGAPSSVLLQLCGRELRGRLAAIDTSGLGSTVEGDAPQFHHVYRQGVSAGRGVRGDEVESVGVDAVSSGVTVRVSSGLGWGLSESACTGDEASVGHCSEYALRLRLAPYPLSQAVPDRYKLGKSASRQRLLVGCTNEAAAQPDVGGGGVGGVWVLGDRVCLAALISCISTAIPCGVSVFQWSDEVIFVVVWSRWIRRARILAPVVRSSRQRSS